MTESTRFCAVCGDEHPASQFTEEPIGVNDRMVLVCSACSGEHPRSGRYAFSGLQEASTRTGVAKHAGKGPR